VRRDETRVVIESTFEKQEDDAARKEKIWI